MTDPQSLNGGSRIDIDVPLVNIGSEEDYKLGAILTLRKVIMHDGSVALTNAHMKYDIDAWESSRSTELRSTGFLFNCHVTRQGFFIQNSPIHGE